MAIHIYTHTIHRTTQITTNVVECGPCPVFASFTLALALQLRKRHGKTSVRVRKTSVRLRRTSVRVEYTFTKAPTHYKTLTHTHTHITKPTHTHTRARAHIHITKQYKTTIVQIKTKCNRKSNTKYKIYTYQTLSSHVQFLPKPIPFCPSGRNLDDFYRTDPVPA